MSIPTGAPSDLTMGPLRLIQDRPANMGGGWILQQWSSGTSSWVSCPGYRLDGTLTPQPPQLA
jgi:hypothetical protein